MEVSQLSPCEVHAVFDADMVEPQAISVAGGAAAIVSTRRPDSAGPNQDAAAVISTASGGAVLVVSDGCGGMAAGDQAARIAIEALSEHITVVVEGQEMRGAIQDGIEDANRRIMELRAGAGATIAVVLLENDEARPFHVGDSQILLVGGRGKLKMLTTSHSPVGYAVESGLLEEEHAIDHEERHLVSNYLGYEAMHVEVGSSRVLAAHDALLVASDGVMDNLLVEELVTLMSTGRAPTIAAKIAGLARERMTTTRDGQPHKPDDLTAIVFTRRGAKPGRGLSSSS